MAHIQRSRYLGEYGETKETVRDRRIILHRETVAILKQLKPLHVTPEMPVFTNLDGKVIEPKQFGERRNKYSGHWRRSASATRSGSERSDPT